MTFPGLPVRALSPHRRGARAGTAASPVAARLRRLRRYSRLLAVTAVVVAVLAIDLARPPQAQVSARALLVSIDLYQATLSPLLARSGARCRFAPSCSHYGEGAIREDGALVGSARAAWRVLRCGPWTPAGTVDPP